MKFLDLGWQRDQLEPELSAAISEVISHGNFVNGDDVQHFERNFSSYVGTSECVSCANGTDALELIFEALGIGRDSEVIVPAMTFAATSEAVWRAGAKPVLVDVDESATLDLQLVLEALTSKTRAVVAVHLYGFPVDVPLLAKMLADVGREDIDIIEDSAQAHGSRRRSQMAGGMGKAAAFSFYPGKNLGAFSDAGAVTPSDPNLAEKVRRLSNHGRLEKFDHEIVGRNSRMDSIQAAILSIKLTHLEKWLSRRREIASFYLEALGDVSWINLPAVPNDGLHGWHQFAVEVPDRPAVRKHLGNAGIPTGVHYPKCLPDLPFHADSPPSNFPRAVRLAKHELSLPVGEHLTDSDVERVVSALQAFNPHSHNKANGS